MEGFGKEGIGKGGGGLKGGVCLIIHFRAGNMYCVIFQFNATAARGKRK